MSKRRPRAPGRYWHEQGRLYFLKPRNPTSPSERRRALLQVGALALVFLAVPATVYVVLTSRGRLGFDEHSPDAWVRAITTGDSTSRAEMVLRLGESDMVARVPCPVLVGLLDDSADVRAVAVPTLANALRTWRCVDLVVRELTAGKSVRSREAAARVVARVGPSLRAVATEPLLASLRNDPPVRLAALSAVLAMDDTSTRVIGELERLLGDHDPAVRVEVINGLDALVPQDPRVAPALRAGLRDTNALVRAAAEAALARAGRSRPE